MATVMGFTELLMSRDADEEQQIQWLAWLDHLYEDSRRVIATVDELLNVSRIQSGNVSVKCCPWASSLCWSAPRSRT